MQYDTRFLTTDEAAEFLRQSKRTLEKWRREGKGPFYIRVSQKNVKYARERLERFMMRREVPTIDDEL
jgi:excisionase family DNA binding protein